MTTARALRHIATVGPIGWMPFFPGTWGSAFATVIWWLFLNHANPSYQVILITLTTVLGIVSATVSERELGHDAKPIVIDEVIGQWITLMFVPHIWYWFLIAFFTFRVFDIIKPPPVDQSQRLPKGFGIVIDDILAGGYAGLFVLILQRVFNG